MKILKALFFVKCGFRSVRGFSTLHKNPLFSSYYLVKHITQEYQIDDSHNHNHVKEVLFWATKIIQGLEFKLHQRDLVMIGQACLLHDLVDRKYQDHTDLVRSHLETIHPIHETEIILQTIHSMSYSKTVKQGKLCLPEWMEDSPFQNVFHITREADLLSSYNLARMIEYRRAKKPNLTKKEIIEECRELYEKRMDTLISSHLFTYSSSFEIAKHLHFISKYKLDLIPTVCEYKNLDILKMVNHLSIFDLISDFESLPRKSL